MASVTTARVRAQIRLRPFTAAFAGCNLVATPLSVGPPAPRAVPALPTTLEDLPLPRLRLAFAVVVVVLATTAAACGTGRTGGPRAAPTVVVGQAAERTLAAGDATLVAASRGLTLEARVDLASGRGRGHLFGPNLAKQGEEVDLDYRAAYEGRAGSAVADAEVARSAPEELLGPGLQPGNPLAVLDLLGAASKVHPYGGTAVRGVATHRYSVEVDGARVPAAAGLGAAVVKVEVWIDDGGRVRRVQVANDLRDQTTTTDRAGLFPVTIIDLVGFEKVGR